LDALPRVNSSATALPMPEAAIGRPLCEGLRAFTGGDYAAACEGLTRVRNIARRCGGSLAQCDLIHLTFTEAALRASRARLAHALVAERSAQKPASLLNQLLQQRLLTMSAAA